MILLRHTRSLHATALGLETGLWRFTTSVDHRCTFRHPTVHVGKDALHQPRHQNVGICLVNVEIAISKFIVYASGDNIIHTDKLRVQFWKPYALLVRRAIALRPKLFRNLAFSIHSSTLHPVRVLFLISPSPPLSPPQHQPAPS